MTTLFAIPQRVHPPRISSTLKRHGGKSYLAKRIIDLMPRRTENPNALDADDPGWLHFVEPYFGAGSVLLGLDPSGISEVANDIDGELTNFWDVLKSPIHFPEFRRLAALTPVSQVEFERTNKDHPLLTPPERALRFLVRNRQSRQALERDFVTPVRNRTRRGMQEHISAWLSAIEGLPELHARLQRVLILNKPALDVIRSEDGPRTLFYCDPPYLHSTRTSTKEYGDHEMSEEDHRELLRELRRCRGKVMISGYASRRYDSELRDWTRHEFDLPNNAAGGKSKKRKTEIVWCNFK